MRKKMNSFFSCISKTEYYILLLWCVYVYGLAVSTILTIL